MFKRLFGRKNKEEVKEEIVEEVAVETSEEEATEEAAVEATPEAAEETVDETEEAVEETEEVEELSEEIEEAKEEIAEAVEEIKEEFTEAVDTVVEEMEEAVEEAKEAIAEEVQEIMEEAVEEVEEIVETAQEIVEEQPVKKGFFGKLVEGLTKTSKAITDRIDDLINNYGEIDEDLFEELEEILITADVGMNTTMEIIDRLRDELKVRKINDSSMIKDVLKDVMVELLTSDYDKELNVQKSPTVVFVIGVNGAGKTTSIGKIAHKLKRQNKSVLLCAGDTFRAAAIDQLKVWGDRVGVDVISQQEGSDPASVVYDAIQAAKARKTDVLICDTAGRLHNKKNLMNELAKIFRIVNREYPEAEKEVLLVLDGTTGQNAIQQAKLFKEAAEINGLVLTKLDGTAKGGAVLAINSEVGIPVKLIGVGEGLEDLQEFDADNFVKALLNM